jgi:hypothetical protein
MNGTETQKRGKNYLQCSDGREHLTSPSLRLSRRLQKLVDVGADPAPAWNILPGEKSPLLLHHCKIGGVEERASSRQGVARVTPTA